MIIMISGALKIKGTLNLTRDYSQLEKIEFFTTETCKYSIRKPECD